MKVKKKSDKPFWSMDLVCSGFGNSRDNGAKGAVPCGSTLEIDLNDIYVTTACHFGETDIYYSVRCPECGSVTDIPAKDLPAEIRNYVEARYKNGKNKSQERDM